MSSMQLWNIAVIVAFLATGGSAQTAINITGCTVNCNLATTPADVVIFVDASTGMGQANIQLIKSALIQWQAPFSIGPSGSSDMLRVGLVDYAIYGTAHGLLVENHDDHAEMINLINDITPRNYQQRNLYFGLIEGYTNLNPDVGGMRPGVPKFGFIFSSGAFTGNPPSTAYNSYVAQGFNFYGIAVGIDANTAELGGLVGSNRVFHTVNAEQLQYVVGWLLNKICDSSTPGGTATFEPPPTTITVLPYRHCQDYCSRGDTSSGVKPILINGSPVNVYCNGCWTTIQSRYDGGMVDFNVSFDRYRQVLGDARNLPNADFYLGNDNIYALTSQFDMQLWVQPEDCDYGITNALYSWFKIGSLSEQFKLNISYAIGDAGDAFNIVSFGISDQGRPFSTAATYDNLGLPASHCPSLLYGGWWFGSCKDNLNGKWYNVKPPYCETTVPDGIRWIRPGNFTLLRSKMYVCTTCPQPF